MKAKNIVKSAVLLASTALIVLRKRRAQPALRRERSSHRRLRENERQAADQATRRYIMYVLFPAWSLAGFLDWLWHRQTKIETTSGLQESITHALMMFEVGVPVLMGMFLEINAGVLASMAVGWLVHEATVAWDVGYTVSRRKVLPGEQHTHSFMETIPFDILAVLACLHPDQFLSLLGAGPEKPDFSLRLKEPPVPIRHAMVLFIAMALSVAAPHAEELWRCWQAQRKGLAGLDTPRCARELYVA